MMAGVNSGKAFSLDSRQPLATEPRETAELPGDLPSLSWLTTVDVTRLQQTAVLNWPDLNTDLEINTMDPQTDQKSLMKRTDEYNPIAPFPERNANRTWNDVVCRSCHTGKTLYEQHLVVNPHRIHNLQQTQTFPKPIYSYSCLIAMALKNSPTCRLTVREIYRFMRENFPYFKTAPEGWKNSVRHNLSFNKCFEKVQNKLSSKGYLWVLNPAIHERESRRSRHGTAKISLRAQTDLQPGAFTTDWDNSSHTVLNCSHNTPTGHTPYKDIPSLHVFHTDIPGQADNSDPYLIEFAGNLWEEMKEDSWNPETEDNFHKCLFDSKFVVSEAEPLLLDQLPVAGPYTTYTTIGVPFQAHTPPTLL